MPLPSPILCTASSILHLIIAVEGEILPTSTTVTSLQRQTRFDASLQGLRTEVHSVERAFLLQKCQVNSAMLLASPGKMKVNAGAFSVILDLTLAEVGGDSRPSMQSEPYQSSRRCTFNNLSHRHLATEAGSI